MKSQTISSVFMGLFVIMLLAISSNVRASAGLYQQDNLTAVLSDLEGDVQVRDAADGQFAKATEGQLLPVLGQVQTGEDGRARLDLSSGTILRVAPSSLFTFESNEPDSSGKLSSWFNLESGKLWVILKGGHLDIKTPAGVASVRSSYLSIHIEKLADGTIKITATCFEGHCALGNGAGDVPLVTGQASEYSYDPATGVMTEPTTRIMTDEEIADWEANIPESKDIMDFVLAAIEELKNAEQGTIINGTIQSLLPSGSGSFAFNPKFSLGATQVSITDPLTGMVTASVIKRDQFIISKTVDNHVLLSHGVSIDMDGSGYVQVCFAYIPTKSDFSVVRWDSSNQTASLPGRWMNMNTYREGLTICSKVPKGTFALAGL